MSSVPTDPEAFFGDWLRASFAPLAARVAGQSSPGAVVFQIGARAPLALRLAAGELRTEAGLPADTIVQVTLAEHAFEPVLVRGAEQLAGDSSNPERQLAVLRALTLDAERVALVRSVTGSVAFVLGAEGESYEIVLTPGTRPRPAQAECVVRCALSEFLALQRGESNPFELLMNGKLQITGDAQIPMALSSLLV